jgi:hypothetical protein
MAAAKVVIPLSSVVAYITYTESNCLVLHASFPMTRPRTMFTPVVPSAVCRMQQESRVSSWGVVLPPWDLLFVFNICPLLTNNYIRRVLLLIDVVEEVVLKLKPKVLHHEIARQTDIPNDRTKSSKHVDIDLMSHKCRPLAASIHRPSRGLIDHYHHLRIFVFVCSSFVDNNSTAFEDPVWILWKMHQLL